jgi:hypothetical protein
MPPKRNARAQRRANERTDRKAARTLIHDRERLAKLTSGGAPERPIAVPAASVIQGRVESLPCPQCEGRLRIELHRAVGDLRALDVRCQQCGAPRTLWVRIVPDALN